MKGFSIGKRIFGRFWICPWLGLLAYAGPIHLTPDKTVAARLEPGSLHLYRVNLEKAGFWRVRADQVNINISVTFKDDHGKILAAVDSPLDEWGTEWLTVETEAAGIYEIEIQGGQTLRLAGEYLLRLDWIDPSESTWIQAEMAVTRAGQLYFQGGTENRRAAIPHLKQAISHWRQLKEKPRLARDIYCVAVLHRLLGESRPALDRAEQVLALWHEIGNRRFEGFTLNEIGLLRLRNNEFDLAAERFQEAMAVRRQAGHALGAAISHNNWCITKQARGLTEEAIPCFERVLRQFQTAKAPTREAAVRVTLGRLHNNQTRFKEAEEHYRRALALFQASDDRRGMAMLNNNLGAFHSRLGNFEEAQDHYHEALKVFQELKDRRWQARTLNNLGNGYLRMGMPERALFLLEQALPIRREQNDTRGEIITLFNLGKAQELAGEPERGESYFQQALAIATSGKSRLNEARAFTHLAWNLKLRGRSAEGLTYLDQAIEIFNGLSYPLERKSAKMKRGYILADAGRLKQAESELEDALTWFAERELDIHQAVAHQGLALVHARQGHSSQAEQHARASVALVEARRLTISGNELRDSFFGQRQGPYELLIDILLQRHRSDPAADWLRKAMEVRERARARGFAELIHQAGIEIEKGADSGLLQRLEAASQQAHALAGLHEKLAATQKGAERNHSIRLQLEQTLRSLENIEAQIRRQNPAFAALGQPARIKAEDIQGLADQETTLLIYTLGDRRSHLWQVSPDTIHAFELPGRAQIEETTLNALNSIKVYDPGRSGQESLQKLSRLLLGPAAARLAGKRLVVVPDGVLHYLPFDVLPNPSESGAGPIGRRFEIVHLASISALWLQRNKGKRPANTQTLAVFADPVFQADDPRVSPIREAPEGESTSPVFAAATPGYLIRLPATRREAEAILELVPEPQRFAALDFEAGKSVLFERDLSRFRLLHFATHGFIDSIHPRLSGIALSLIDPRGKPVDGYLRLMDIFNLELNAELVVLSGCQTALGRNIAGEGMVGITRGFLYAGARGVVASMWPVPERATAQLMGRFYQYLLREGQPPAAALRLAKGSLARERSWRHPYFWGAFVFQGDWRAQVESKP